MPQISLDEIEQTVRTALAAHGAEAFAAAEVARAVRKAESVGNKICGLYYVESYCQQLKSGRVSGSVTPKVETPRSGTVVVDAGVASLSVAHAHTCTSLGYFTEQIADAGMIAIGFTNASPIVAAPGGKTRSIGTNPIAFSVPDGKGGIAMQFDQSTTTVALGKITMAKAAGQSIPEGWALDVDGNPTTNPDAAIKGSLVSMGGYKGWGFGLMAELLAAAMTGSVMSRDVKPLKAPEGAPHDLGQYYLIIDPSVSTDFGERVQALAEHIAQDEGARMPGQNKVSMDPVDVGEDTWALITGLAGA